MALGTALMNEITGTEPPSGRMAFWWLGQLGYAYKLGGKTILADPYLNPDPNRVFPPVVEAAAVTCADIVLGTHDHSDHIDYPTWRAIAKASPEAVFVCSALLADRLSGTLGISRERIVGLRAGETKEIKGFKISGVAAAHEGFDIDEATGLYPHMGYVVKGGGVSFYHAGDTCVYDGMAAALMAYGTFDAVFLPINGRSGYKLGTGCIGNMTYQEAADLVGLLRPRLTVPGHYEMHPINLENPLLFYNYLAVKYPALDCWLGSHGEQVVVEGGTGYASGKRWPE